MHVYYQGLGLRPLLQYYTYYIKEGYQCKQGLKSRYLYIKNLFLQKYFFIFNNIRCNNLEVKTCTVFSKIAAEEE